MNLPRRIVDDGAGELERKPLGSSLWLKGLAIGFGAGTLTMGTASLVAHRSSPADRGVERPPPAYATEQTVASATAAEPAATITVDSTIARVHGATTEENAPPPPPPSLEPLPSRATMPRRSARAEELATINAVRAALVAKEARAAIAGLDQYELKYPTASFGLEAQLLRIEALAVSGRPQAAKELASAFLAAHPDSPYAPRLRAFVSNETSFQ